MNALWPSQARELFAECIPTEPCAGVNALDMAFKSFATGQRVQQSSLDDELNEMLGVCIHNLQEVRAGAGRARLLGGHGMQA